MKAIKILSYFFYGALFIMVFCSILNFKFKYFGPIMGCILVASSVLFILDAYRSRKKVSINFSQGTDPMTRSHRIRKK